MKVILLNNVKGIGRIGDVKEVNDGYARNYLLPRGLGKAASAGAIKEAELIRATKLDAATMERAHAVEIASKLHGTTIIMHGKANEKGTLFSGIPRSAVADKVSEVAGIHIAPDRIRSDDHLKHVGQHQIHIRLAEGVTADVTIDIQ